MFILGAFSGCALAPSFAIPFVLPVTIGALFYLTAEDTKRVATLTHGGLDLALSKYLLLG